MNPKVHPIDNRNMDRISSVCTIWKVLQHFGLNVLFSESGKVELEVNTSVHVRIVLESIDSF